jgi:hypothetical protein
MLVLRSKEFGTRSKILGATFPGAWQAKEAAKYGYDEDEYRRKRAGYALKGAFTPGVATAIKKKAEKMQKEGYSKKEIREFLEKSNGGRIAAGVGEFLTGGLGGVTPTVATAVGLADTVMENRAGKGMQRHSGGKKRRK